jgi:hypothetical protein
VRNTDIYSTDPSIHWSVSIIGTAPFGFGMVLVFLSCMNYLIDSYTIYAASVLAANSVLRSLFGAAFPLFTSQMYGTLGIHWASTIPAFLALACLPFPFLFYKYGEPIRMKCKYAAQAHQIMQSMKAEAQENEEESEDEKEGEKPRGDGPRERAEDDDSDASSETVATETAGRTLSRGTTRERSSSRASRRAALVKTHSYSSHYYH